MVADKDGDSDDEFDFNPTTTTSVSVGSSSNTMITTTTKTTPAEPLVDVEQSNIISSLMEEAHKTQLLNEGSSAVDIKKSTDSALNKLRAKVEGAGGENGVEGGGEKKEFVEVSELRGCGATVLSGPFYSTGISELRS